MKTYKDSFGMFHDKPVIDGKPSSNNGYIYTSFAMLLGEYINNVLIYDFINKCMVKRGIYKRRPDLDIPAMSRDEVQGLAILIGANYCRDVIKNNYYINNLGDPEPSTFWEKIKIYWKHKSDHRSWIFNEPKIWAWAFTLPIQDQYFIDHVAYGKTTWFKTIWFYISSILTVTKDVKKPSDAGNRNLLWAKLEYLGRQKSWLYKLCDHKQMIPYYFGEEHLFSKIVRRKG